MLQLRPFEVADLDHLLALPVHVALGTFLADRPAWQARLATPSGDQVHRFGAWEGPALRGFVELAPGARGRTRHTAALHLGAVDEVAAAALLGRALDLADRWLALGRLSAEVEEGDPHLAWLHAAGFEREGALRGHRERDGLRRDVVLLGRLRPGWVPEPPAPPPAWLPPVPCPSPRVRPVRPEDADALGALMGDERVAWGTLQLPSSSGDLWRVRLARPWGQVYVVEQDGMIVGNGGIHPLPPPSAHVSLLGMSVAADRQGAGLGGLLMAQIVAAGRERGLAKLELEVYADNPRARRLYERFGFEVEATKRHDVWRAGGYASSLVMGRWL